MRGSKREELMADSPLENLRTQNIESQRDRQAHKQTDLTDIDEGEEGKAGRKKTGLH